MEGKKREQDLFYNNLDSNNSNEDLSVKSGSKIRGSGSSGIGKMSLNKSKNQKLEKICY